MKKNVNEERKEPAERKNEKYRRRKREKEQKERNVGTKRTAGKGRMKKNENKE